MGIELSENLAPGPEADDKSPLSEEIQTVTDLSVEESSIKRGRLVLRSVRGMGNGRTREPKDFEDQQSVFTPEQLNLFSKFYSVVEVVARKITIGGRSNREEYEEALSAGYHGLVKAVIKFDTTKMSELAEDGVEFIRKTVEGEIRRNIRDRYYRAYEQKDGSKKTVKKQLSVMTGSALSFHQPVSSDGGPDTLLEEVIGSRDYSDEDIINQIQIQTMAKQILGVVGEFPPREKEIFVRRTRLDQNQNQIASAMKISQMHVSRLLRKMYRTITEKAESLDGYYLTIEDFDEDPDASIPEGRLIEAIIRLA